MLTLGLVLTLLPQGPAPSRHVRDLPELGIQIVEERRFDAATGRFVRVMTDSQGRAIDADSAVRQNLALRDARLGKLHPQLAEELQQPGDHQVAFWLRRAPQAADLRRVIDDARASGTSPEDARRMALATAAAEVTPGNQAFAAAAAAAGADVLHVDTITPVVFVEAPADVIRRLAARAEVDLAYTSARTWFAEGPALEHDALLAFNDFAGKTARTDVVHRRGITGTGVKVLVNDVGPTSLINPFLPPVIAGATGSATSHATAVAGIIASTHVPHTGAAPGLTELYCYGGSGDVNAPLAWAWGMSQGISFGNCSWWNGQKGQIRFLDRYFDYIIRQFAVMMFKSSGNQGGSDGLTTTPGNGYNMTASGNANDANNYDWKDDVMASSSSWVDPAEGHTKPEVTACGTGITTTRLSSPWIGNAGTGTSYASPVTCGTAALLAQTAPALQAQPEVVRALLMAGAFHNVEGDPVISARDGTGHVNAAASQQATADGQYQALTLTPGSFTGGVLDIPIDLIGNDETRLCAVWFSLADSSYSTVELQMDLDLTVWFGNTLVASSASLTNAFELVQFVPPATGTYTVRLQNQRFLGTSEPFALAWVTRRDAATNEVVISGSPTLGGVVDFEFVDTYHPGQSYIALLSAEPPPAFVPVGPKKVLEIGFDGVSELSLGLPGFVGVFGANGRATTSVGVPNLPFLTGLVVRAGVVTLEPSLPELVEETSPTASFTIQ